MPLTAKEKMKRYRERIKLDVEKTAAVKLKDRNRKNVKKATLNKKELKKQRLKNRERVRKHRREKKLVTPDMSQGNAASGPSSHSTNVAPTKKITPQSIGKAKRRAIKFLPKSPRTKRAVVASLGSDLGIYQPHKRTRTTYHASTETEGVVDKVKEFYETTSYTCPGLKDFVLVREGTNKKKVQKHYMLVTLKEAYSTFLEDNPDVKVSFSRFAALRPVHVCLQGSIPHNTCLCKIHENFRLLLIALENTSLKLSTSFRQFVDTIVCDQEKELCMTGQCEECPHFEKLEFDENEGNGECEWNQWSFDQMKTVKIVEEGTNKDCVEELKKQLPQFLRHTYTKRVQAQHFVDEKTSVLSAPLKAIVQVDFAENYTTKFQDEIQSAYWSYSQVTLFTVCVWAQEGPLSLAIVSDYLSHDKYAVHTFLEDILIEIEVHYGRKFKEIVFFSDGAASQFKQKYHLNNMMHLQCENIQWTFFATSHGKGPVDCIGGELKRRVKMKVLSGQANVLNATDFFTTASMTDGKTKVLFCSEEKIKENIARLNELSEFVLPLPKTQSVHWIKKVSPGVIQYKSDAAANELKIHRFHAVRPNEKDHDMPNGDDGLALPNTTNENATVTKIQVGSWVVVKYCQKRSTLSYTGQVIRINKESFLVRYLSKLNGEGARYIWPKNDDEDEVDEESIVQILKEPQMDRRGVMTFSNSGS